MKVDVVTVTSILKKWGLDIAEIKNFRSITNLSTISNNIERLATTARRKRGNRFLAQLRLVTIGLPVVGSFHRCGCLRDQVLRKIESFVTKPLHAQDASLEPRLEGLDLPAVFLKKSPRFETVKQHWSNVDIVRTQLRITLQTCYVRRCLVDQ